MAIASSSCFIPNSDKYDVFLSFRGKDTRRNFTSHLYAALCREKILAYIDDNLKSGEEISSALLTTIAESKLSIVIFSENYASSRWCLDELVCIMDCKEKGQHIVLPVFYGIDPTDVRHQKASYADAFVKHEERYKDKMNKVQQWRKALTAAANLSGFDSRNNLVLESTFVEQIVKAVLEKLYSYPEMTSDHDFTGLVGMDKRFGKMKSLLHVGYPDVRIIGIWGMGGIGKTTLAEIVYNQFFNQFEGCYFANVREELSEYELRDLKKNLLSELLKDKNLDHMHSSFANDRLRRKKVLIVLDNISERKQLEYLLGDPILIGASQQRKELFGIGSRIILTSRDKKLLLRRAHYIYEVEPLEFDEARKLFYWKAFGGDSPMSNLVELSGKVVNYAQGNPLALNVLGSHLCCRTTIREWKSALVELEKAPNKEIHQVLKISYDALDDRKKAIFLDIACFLTGEDRDLAEGILGIESHIGISILIEKSLLRIKDCKLSMHDLVRQMAWEIVRGDPKEVGQRSRLFNIQDVYYALKNNKGTAITEGIFLDVSKIQESLWLSSTTFKDMCNLRFLKIHKPIDGNFKLINIPQGLRYLPHSLRYLVWRYYPSKSLASNFEPQNLVKLDMCSSKLKELWNGVKHLGNMKDIDLSFCEELTKLPDLSQAPKLENMNLRGCKNLHRLPNISPNIKDLILRRSGIETFPSSFEFLENLVHLDLRVCESLKSLPKLPRNIKTLRLLTCRKLESLPSNIWELKSLKTLNLYNCARLKILPEVSEVGQHIKSLQLEGTGIKELPSSIENLIGLRHLELNRCENLKLVPKGLCALSRLSRLTLSGLELGCFPSILLGFHSLTSLELCYCNIPEIPGWLGSLSSLTKIDLRGNNFDRIPSCIRQLCNLQSLNVSRCKNLRLMLELQSSIENVEATECTSLETVDSTSKVVNELVRSDWTEDEVGYLFFNCSKIDQSSRHNILINVLSQVFHIATTGNERSSAALTQFVTIQTCYPGSRIPKWFTNQCEGSTATIKPPSNWLNNKFLGFATCVALEFEDRLKFNYLRIDTTIHFKTNQYGEKDEVCDFQVYFISDVVEPTDKESFTISSDHVFIWYVHAASKFQDMNLDAVAEASFDFSPTLFSGIRPNSKQVTVKVKRCGIRMIYLPEAEEEGRIYYDDFMIKQGLYSSNIVGSCSEESVRSGGSLLSELVEEPELIITNLPEPSGTETIGADVEESPMQRIKFFDFCSCLPFISIISEWKVRKEN